MRQVSTWMKEKISFMGVLCAVLWAYVLYQIYPIWRLSWYAHTNQDDWWMSFPVHGEWVDTHSVWKTLVAAWDRGVFIYKTWDGCFLSMTIGSIPPSVFGEKYYCLTFSIIVGMLLLGAYSFFWVVLRCLGKYRKSEVLAVLALLTLILLEMFPFIKEGYSWWVGGINYTFFYGVFLLSQAFLVHYLVKKSKISLILGSILSFCVGLGNLLTGLLNPEVVIVEAVVLWLVCRFGAEKKAYDLKFFLPVCCSVVGLGINVLCPGNLLRGDGLLGNNPFLAIKDAIVLSTQMIATFHKASMIPIYLTMGMILFYGAVRAKSKVSVTFVHPVAVTVVLYLLYCSVITPIVYVGTTIYGRCLNQTFLSQHFFTVLVLFYWAGWMAKHLKPLFRIAHPYYHAMIVGGLLSVFWSMKVHEFDHYTIYCRVSLEQGYADIFQAQMMERFKVYEDPNVKDCMFNSIDYVPSILYFDEDCLEDIKGYYDKNSITIVQQKHED